jgi:hypothetical protein
LTQEIEGADPAEGPLSFGASAEPWPEPPPLCGGIGAAEAEAAVRFAFSVERGLPAPLC